jgi:ubiquinone/menaquinone biosynthesis C-methylase UbiE
MASSYTATDAHAYEHLMGRWSGRLAKELIAFAGVETGDRVLDVGCGTGSMALAPAARLNLRGSWVSISRTIISPLPRRVPRTRVAFLTGAAIALDLPAGSFDHCFSLLALNFMSDPVRPLPGMRRLTCPGGGSCRGRVGFCGRSGLSADLLGYRRRARSRRRASKGPTLLKPVDQGARARRCF